MIIQSHIAILDRVQPLPVFVIVGRIDHNKEVVICQTINQQVIKRHAVHIQQKCIMRIAHTQALHIICRHSI